MKIHHAIEAPATDRPLVVAIGFFDGFHRGHREIVRALMRARRPGERAAILTFRNHPATYLRPDAVPAPITTLEERVDLLAATGIDELFVVPFDASIASLDARAFCRNVLLERLRVRSVVVGENFRFGHGRTGDAALAREVLEPHGICVVEVAPLRDRGERISSTRVRQAIAAGEMERADALLAYGYAVAGTVELGAGRGHDLGFPTANLAVSPAKTLPRDGVYTARARYDGNGYAALVSIGTNPTFTAAGMPSPRTVEAWLLDFDATIYGRQVELRELRFVREQRRFDSAEELVAQMREDATSVRFPSFATS